MPESERTEHFRLIERIGSGRHGIVWRARRRVEQDVVAVKRFHDIVSSRPGFRERLLSARNSLSFFDHPSVVPVLSFMEDFGTSYLVMRHFDGVSLARALQRNVRLPQEAACAVLQSCTEALNAAQEGGISHGTIHPGHILVNSSSIGMLALGTGETLPDDIRPARTMPHGPGSSVFSPLLYAAPELVLGSAAPGAVSQALPDSQATPLADIFSLGTLFFHMLTGRKPSSAESLASLRLSYMAAENEETGPASSLVRPRGAEFAISEGLLRLAEAMTAVNPADRPQNYKNVLAELSRAGRTFVHAGLPPEQMELAPLASSTELPKLRIVPGRADSVREKIRAAVPGFVTRIALPVSAAVLLFALGYVAHSVGNRQRTPGERSAATRNAEDASRTTEEPTGRASRVAGHESPAFAKASTLRSRATAEDGSADKQVAGHESQVARFRQGFGGQAGQESRVAEDTGKTEKKEQGRTADGNDLNQGSVASFAEGGRSPGEAFSELLGRVTAAEEGMRFADALSILDNLPPTLRGGELTAEIEREKKRVKHATADCYVRLAARAEELERNGDLARSRSLYARVRDSFGLEPYTSNAAKAIARLGRREEESEAERMAQAAADTERRSAAAYTRALRESLEMATAFQYEQARTPLENFLLKHAPQEHRRTAAFYMNVLRREQWLFNTVSRRLTSGRRTALIGMRDEATPGGIKWLKVTKLARKTITLVEYTDDESRVAGRGSRVAGQGARARGVAPDEERGQIETAWSYLPPKAIYALFLKCGIDNESADEHLALASIAFHHGLTEEARTELAHASSLDPKLNDEAQRYASLLSDLEHLGLLAPGPSAE